jgi:large subunit ribosomal protein L5
MARLLEKYRTEIIPKLKERFGLKNSLAVPRLENITISMGVGRAVENRKILDAVSGDLALIAGQRPVICLAKQSVSSFKLREGMPIGCKVTLRRNRMYEFFDRLIAVTIPRIRDFRGLNPRSFDGRGNFSLGVTEQFVFPEISIDKVEFVQGMNITMVIRNSDDEKSLALLKLFGMPFKGD